MFFYLGFLPAAVTSNSLDREPSDLPDCTCVSERSDMSPGAIRAKAYTK